ncbi:MAG TPA: hypothetical protein PKA33_15500 [Amaricoccus sp.]|uniref:hypothetical protein n=1 Tax=Amaricoccus sp. TaxID=1872485 RepID=UPI002C0F2DCB|nr:hypothetical protein [Amaricoccus sp.]HMQ92014.1 hypothetical protein [Amaricoccus sp.]HMR53742.1 hypothetical protein [Amaricoccus sp.]HMR60867.1 hypothetical protein [Amaricoccus sp.]HMU00753.1 hypothetical protein [Amaricoccus sp.]
MSDFTDSHSAGGAFIAAVDRFAAILPRIPASGGTRAEVTTRAARVRDTLALALDCGGGEGFTTADIKTLGYVTERLGTMLDIAEVAVALTGSRDTGFDERVFADNLQAVAPEDLHGVAQLVSLDAGTLGRCDISRRFEALAGVSAGVGPGLATISKALIIVGAFVLVLRGQLSPRRFRFLVEELFAIDGLLAPIGVTAAAPDAEGLRHCTPRDFEAKAGEVTTFRFATESPPAGGIIEVSVDGAKEPPLDAVGAVFKVVGKATVTLHYKSPNRNGTAGVEIRRRRIF